MALACAVCASEVAWGARFCSACGAPQALTCPSCGTQSDASAAFCSACGASLRDGGPKSPIADEREERRVVTVLFADMAGWTALAERLDPEDVRVVQGELFELVNGQVELHGGMTEKFVGDAVLAVFGIPQAHEDDPERAVRAAIAVRDDFPRLASELERRHGAAVGLRIGVNTGDVVSSREAAARGELVVSGDAVNVAARLQQAAKPGEVLVGERTRAGTSRVVEYEDRGGIDAKGKRTPVAAWAAVGVARRPQRRGIDGLSAPIVGRDEELAVLSAVAARVERDRVPQLVTLFGVAGVGKSRLLAELVDRLPGVRLLEGRCLPYGDGVTYWPLAQVAKEHAGILESDMAAVARRKLEAAVGSVVPAGETEAVVEAVGWTIGFAVPGSSSADLASGEVRAQLYGAWRRYVAALGRETPTVLAIDDIHWASEPLLDLLDDLADTLADTSVLIVCPARPELLETRPGWGARKQNAIALNLMPLLPSDARRLVAELLDEDRILDDVRARILERADGNPFYLEEILRMLIERGAIEQNDGGWIATGRPTDVPIPDSVHGVIAARVDLLDVPARDALRRCSAVGRIFWPAAVGVDDELVEALGRRGLVSEQPLSGIEGLREFAFKHALTRDVAYQSLPRHERRVLHRAIGAWVERVSGRTAEVAEIAAYHFGEAIRYGDDDPGTVRHAYELLHEAGEAAITRAAIPSAIGLFERAAALAPDERSRCAALIALGRCDVGELRYDRARTRLFEADEIARGLGDGPLHAEILSWVSRASWLGGFWDDAMAAAREAVAALDGLPESPTLSTALARLSQLEMLRGMPECEETAARAIEVGRRVGDSFAEINGLINVFTARGARGEPLERAEAFELLERATDERLWDEAYRVVVNYLWAASPYETIPDLRDVVAHGDERLSGLHGVEFSSFGQYFALSRARFLWIPSGQWDRVDDELRASGKIEAQGSNWLLVREIVAGMALRRGALHFVDELAPEWVERAISSCEPQRLVPMASVVLARAALGGDGALIHAITPHVIEIVTDGRQWAPFASPALPRSLYAAREHELLRALDECLTQRGEGERFARTTSAACSGLSALADGRAHDALPLLQEVTALEIERGAYYGAACAELDLALAYDALRETGPAADARERARAVLEPLGCVNPF